ncbi:hypothetical protein, partial [Streptomyces spinoverrucosus]|uniref:hypothetical protein n=1 Tax=Streptomyces spinoverrucosus TaxID=284043 RepID=UPI001C3F56FC
PRLAENPVDMPKPASGSQRIVMAPDAQDAARHLAARLRLAAWRSISSLSSSGAMHGAPSSAWAMPNSSAGHSHQRPITSWGQQPTEDRTDAGEGLVQPRLVSNLDQLVHLVATKQRAPGTRPVNRSGPIPGETER